ncbi:MAG: hypothetical protein DMF54_07455 [Acidobacteria bacterium]|nr:MAG: hypothetical protein DMF54_07455 [Acidobacteriota bacterium]
MKRMTVGRLSRLGRAMQGPRSRSRPAKRVTRLIGSLESGVSDLAEDDRRYILKSLTKSE